MTSRWLTVALLVGVGVLAWRVGGMLSEDARNMALCMVLGALAGMPTALLVLAVGHHAEPDERTVYQPMTEDAAPRDDFPAPLPRANYPGPMSVIATRFDGDEEWFDDAPIQTASLQAEAVGVLRQMRGYQMEARRNNEPCPDIDKWIADNAAWIEAGMMGVRHVQ